MRRTSLGLLSLALAAGMGVSIGAPMVGALPTATPNNVHVGDAAAAKGKDDLPNPQEDKRRALKDEAIKQVLGGTATPVQKGRSTVVKVKGKGKNKGQGPVDQYVELGRQGTDKIFVILAEFGNDRSAGYPDVDSDPATPGPTTWDGPLHNAIPAPDRSLDNSTNWQPNYTREYFQNLYFGAGGPIGQGGAQESVKQWYERQSSGRYSIDGEVSDWVKVKYNEARYGRDVCGSHVCNNTWALVRDAVNQWVANQKAAGKTLDQIKADLAQYDQWDRYDVDGDGNFNEPDGFIDHFQIVHAGGDQADGDPIQGEDAIWSHRWYAATAAGGPGGQVGTPIADTGMWVGDYTIQPENGGMSVFTHEYGHDLGLPDLYDTATGADNGVNWWSMMSQSRQAGPNDQSIGSRGSDFGAWEKLFLGWLDYQVVTPTAKGTKVMLGPHEYNTDKKQAVVVPLPKKNVVSSLVAPKTGSKDFYGGRTSATEATLARSVTLGAGTSTLSFATNYAIEDCGCDYGYVEVNDGSGWTAIPGTDTRADEGNGVTGWSGPAEGQMGWKDASFDLSAYAGKTVQVRFRYHTDPAYTELGWFVDDVKVVSNGATLVDTGAEGGLEGWTASGWSSVGATTSTAYDNYYIASYRNYASFDSYLQSGPYNFGWLNTNGGKVEHFPYQDGLLISYWDTSQADNNTGVHPGEGLILPVDANPEPRALSDGTALRPRIAGYDAPFSTQQSDTFTFHKNGAAFEVKGAAAKPVFNDGGTFWYSQTATTGVKVPNNGVNIGIEKQFGTSMQIKVWKR
ncbi:immune inhibitor A domain-containing protein [Terrabacter sp. 2RAF25]|uniref:immune inhibitor A domain-containing protein n=1 Tax=Terrabacter sp. 2RAF25 TaxID=3232998 RepID=UPI003F95602B